MESITTVKMIIRCFMRAKLLNYRGIAGGLTYFNFP
jgi:hypothetical protein